MASTGKKTSSASAELDARQRRALQRALCTWYRAAARDLPWRKSRDPYAIWVSEVMLQQTQVGTALPYYERWMARFPDLRALSEADDDEALRLWQGLGYYSRARALLRGAREVMRHFDGNVPERVDELRSLPGIGRYTAGAIASIAYQRPEPVVDGNVERVLCRNFGLGGDPKRAPLAGKLWSLARSLLPPDRPGDFNQALMELGATVCTPRAPRCTACPLAKTCVARATGRVEQLPALRKRPAPTTVRMVAVVLERRGRFLVVKLPPDASRWAGMWQFPAVELAANESAQSGVRRAVAESAGLRAVAGELVATVRHSVTRYRITLFVHRCRELGGKKTSKSAAFKSLQELEGLALPAAHARIARALAKRP